MMKAKLVVVGGDAKKSEIGLNLPATLGRGREASLTLPHPLVSRLHCELYESDSRLFVRDLGSLNGTFVNNQRIDGEAELPVGELLTVGTVTFRAEYEVEAELRPPSAGERSQQVREPEVKKKPVSETEKVSEAENTIQIDSEKAEDTPDTAEEATAEAPAAPAPSDAGLDDEDFDGFDDLDFDEIDELGEDEEYHQEVEQQPAQEAGSFQAAETAQPLADNAESVPEVNPLPEPAAPVPTAQGSDKPAVPLPSPTPPVEAQPDAAQPIQPQQVTSPKAQPLPKPSSPIQAQASPAGATPAAGGVPSAQPVVPQNDTAQEEADAESDDALNSFLKGLD